MQAVAIVWPRNAEGILIKASQVRARMGAALYSQIVAAVVDTAQYLLHKANRGHQCRRLAIATFAKRYAHPLQC